MSVNKNRVIKYLVVIFLMLIPICTINLCAYGATNILEGKTVSQYVIASPNKDDNVNVKPYLPNRAIDGDCTSKYSRWYSSSSNGTRGIKVDLAGNYAITRWRVYCMSKTYGGWDDINIISDFKLQGSANGVNWFDIDTVVGNKSALCDKTITPVAVRYVRLAITKGNQLNNKWASIMEFQVEGSPIIPPTVTTSAGTTNFIKDDSPVVIDNGVTVSDDGNKLASAKVSIVTNFHSGEDVLRFTNNVDTMGDITGSYNSWAGVLTMTSPSSSATLEQWKTALRSVTYNITSSSSNIGSHTISFVVNDGMVDSTSATKIVNVITVPPTVTISPATSITSIAATVSGEVTKSGGEDVTVRGFVYATSANPTISDAKVEVGTGKGAISANLTGLIPGTTYHVRAYAINSKGTSYSADSTFTTLVMPIYQVSFNVNGGSGVNTQNVTCNEKVTEPAEPTKTGYTFGGWYKDTACTDVNKWDFATNTIIENTTLYAKWIASTTTAYKVEHYKKDLAGNYVLADTENLTGTTDTQVSATSKIYTGFTENTSASGRVVSGTVSPDGSLVLKLYYDRNNYTVTYDSQGATTVANPTGQSVTYGATIATNIPTITMPTNPVKTGYIFGGWYTGVNGTGTEFTSANIILDNITAYAKWIASTTTYKVEHYKKDLTGNYVLADTENLTGTTDAQASATPKTYTGFTENTSALGRAASGTISPDGSLVLKLYYDRNNYIVTYDSQGATTVANPTVQAVTYEATIATNIPTITMPMKPVKTGYTFGGWYTGVNGTGTEFTSTTAILGNITAYAKWIASATTTYKVEHYKKGLSGNYVLADTEKLTGTTDTQASATPKTYTGFTENTSALGRVASGTISPDGSLVLKLYYDRNNYIVTYDSQGATTIANPIVQSVTYEATISTNVPTITMPTNPIKTGYTFGGWYTVINGGGTNFNSSTPIYNNITVYAKWNKIPVPIVVLNSVIYDGNGNTSGYVAIASVSYQQGTTVTVSGNTGNLEKTGYTFAGWNTKADGTGTNYSVGDKFVIGNSNVVLYANWAKKYIPENVKYVLIGDYAYNIKALFDASRKAEIMNAINSQNGNKIYYKINGGLVSINGSLSNDDKTYLRGLKVNYEGNVNMSVSEKDMSGQ